MTPPPDTRTAPAAAASSDALPRTGATRSAARSLWVAVGLLFAAAFCFALHNTMAKLTFDHGVTPLTVAATRTWAALLVYVVLFSRKGGIPHVPRPAWLLFAITIACYCIQNPLLLLSFRFIPVGMAVLILYTFPILVSLLAAAMGQERLSAAMIGAAAVAFGGVALVLETGNAPIDWRGFALAAIACVALAGNLVGAAQLNRHMTPLAIPYAFSSCGAVVFAILMLIDGGPVFPRDTEGWLLFIAVTITSPLALVAFYAALPTVGAPRTAIVMNIEPLFTVLLAYGLLGEALGPYQILGGALIVGAVALAARVRARLRR